ncbi:MULTISPECIES: hypothetical protein [Mesonia]|uniref:Uncharacterized protein n=1 Tax=Mesonia oceanica TaxID=2687242 RepID=A0AC61YCY8_9FLAO|nr:MULTISPECIES: hypothetical protein [Mesonia]MAN29336.1 hypothetical protein [Mesonia sp.]MAQ40904.1 hypothetical protein [Mesonia sp.]MBJ98371.1 hypothetical protein [Flavobacteriaceae bacterium]VVV02268.1 hypothetical protein FVB9532_03566 [Mesonia oceanica]|tara:strand:- start:5567 stop:5932 length:366 start_codon:yes stop_codon:yes gene_type:complete
MKKIAVFSLVVLVLSCAGKQDLSPSETAKIVAESFYHGDKATLKKYTTESGYANLSSIQEMFAEDKNSESDFKVVDKQREGEITWIKYSTSYDPKPGIFKLVKEDDLWKVTHNEPQDRGPF